ncbi:MAG: 4a-hydroxytetrahydrobiopterin dehydratase [Acidobacteria bacterium]|nr:4a-hydroxytetrahydrobiopterin dehydratase [Acidobacteriota bacterium]
MNRELITDEALAAAMKTLDGDWTAEENKLRRHFKFDNFAGALDFVNRVGALAEAADHHPDICLGWGYVNFELTTHDRNGITDADIALAQRIDSI